MTTKPATTAHAPTVSRHLGKALDGTGIRRSDINGYTVHQTAPNEVEIEWHGHNTSDHLDTIANALEDRYDVERTTTARGTYHSFTTPALRVTPGTPIQTVSGDDVTDTDITAHSYTYASAPGEVTLPTTADQVRTAITNVRKEHGAATIDRATGTITLHLGKTRAERHTFTPADEPDNITTQENAPVTDTPEQPITVRVPGALARAWDSKHSDDHASLDAAQRDLAAAWAAAPERRAGKGTVRVLTLSRRLAAHFAALVEGIADIELSTAGVDSPDRAAGQAAQKVLDRLAEAGVTPADAAPYTMADPAEQAKLDEAIKAARQAADADRERAARQRAAHDTAVAAAEQWAAETATALDAAGHTRAAYDGRDVVSGGYRITVQPHAALVSVVQDPPSEEYQEALRNAASAAERNKLRNATDTRNAAILAERTDAVEATLKAAGFIITRSTSRHGTTLAVVPGHARVTVHVDLVEPGKALLTFTGHGVDHSGTVIREDDRRWLPEEGEAGMPVGAPRRSLEEAVRAVSSHYQLAPMRLDIKIDREYREG